MPSPTDPNDSNFEDATSRLDEGLRSCRAIVSGYRMLLACDGREEAGEAGFIEVGAGEETA